MEPNSEKHTSEIDMESERQTTLEPSEFGTCQFCSSKMLKIYFDPVCCMCGKKNIFFE